ncbi:universal stress protein PHOS32 isoform X1 [Vitis vinifera]|uniref:Universal stress protein A-like protein n=1 Tax=Vitis vinifera TaxID=29760 RepID=A0A438IMJ8_VITVI|nr:universal stress protein PHOS32 isoform X1 [Vitis vinifera]RVW39179.1 Universal stress protein A-like protein [Vitis vinifera]RVW97940.1 Universal stress protein A-like protein [Vitis vinifera]|eukprot:XP_002282537.1 PREDICTED: universal stress protein PHOS32 isoform X1 [Vitis vinifera]
MAENESKGRKILVAVDEGEESMYALSWCLGNITIQNSKDTIVLLYAKPPLAVYSGLDGTAGMGVHLFSSNIMLTMESYRNEVAQGVMQKAKNLCWQHGDIKVETMIENGDARDVICGAAEKLGVDMVVMGSHGYGLIKRAFLGSVSNHCAQNVKCPVLIVKRPKSTAENK